jgi:hypothetical protein
MKKAYILLVTIFVLQVINFVASLPAYIPSWHQALIQLSTINYVFLFVCYITALVLIGFAIKKHQLQLKAWIKPLVLSFFSLGMLLIGGFITWFSVTDDFISSRTFIKKYTYKNANATVYIYDESFLDPRVSVKVRNGRWPVVKNIYMSGDGGFPEDVSFDAENDRVIIATTTDSITIDAQQIMKY